MAYVEVFVDGSCRWDEGKKFGESACAAVVYSNKKKVAQFARGLGKRTNNVAEYEAVISGLLICAMADLPDPIIYSDSAVVVNQINRKWECKHHDLLPLLLSVREIQESFRFRIIQVPRELVFEPDGLCNQFLDKLSYQKGLLVPKTIPSTA